MDVWCGRWSFLKIDQKRSKFLEKKSTIFTKVANLNLRKTRQLKRKISQKRIFFMRAYFLCAHMREYATKKTHIKYARIKNMRAYAFYAIFFAYMRACAHKSER